MPTRLGSQRPPFPICKRPLRWWLAGLGGLRSWRANTLAPFPMHRWPPVVGGSGTEKISNLAEDLLDPVS